MGRLIRGGRRGTNPPKPQTPQDMEQILGPKGQPQAMADIVSEANPGIYAALLDPERDTRGSWAWSMTHNCQRCVWAVEGLARGYNVKALPRTLDDDYAKPNKNIPKSFLNVSTTPVELHTVGFPWVTPGAREIQSDIISNNPEGARGMLVLYRANSGHVINWEIRNGKVKFYDGQIGQETNITALKKGGAQAFAWGRMDDKEFAPLMRDFVERA